MRRPRKDQENSGTSLLRTKFGAPAGELAGAAIEEGVTRTRGVEITVKMNTGRNLAIVQTLSPNERFNAGDRVRVISSGQSARVAH